MTDDIVSRLIPWSWTPFGFSSPFTGGTYGPGGGVDTTISVNSNIANQVQYYRDLTINAGIVLSSGFTPQIIICRTINFVNTSSQISSDGKAANGATGSTGAGQGGVGGGTNAISGAILTGTTPSTSCMDWSNFYQQGGAGQAGLGLNGAAGTNAAVGRMLLPFMNGLILQGAAGGGGGAAGAGGATAGGTGGLSGLRGGAGGPGTGANGAGGGGGSGIGGGGGGGAGNTTGGTGGNGGAGGGVLIVICDKIIGAAGIISANGLVGGTATGTNAGGGGGGGGGAVLVYVRDGRAVTPTLNVNGGSGGPKIGTGGNGGAGGNGLSQIFRGL